MLVLIVDDNASVRRLLRLALSEDASEIYEASDGAEGLRVYRQTRPDVVLMDIRMPQMDGLASTRAILQQDPHAKVIIITDHDDPDIRLAAQDAGACAFLGKQDVTGVAALLRTLACA